MVRPLFESLFEGAEGYLVTFRIAVRALRDTILPPYTGRVTKLILYTDESLAPLRGLYELRRSFRPIRLTALRRGARRLYKVKDGSESPLTLRSGDELLAEITFYTRGSELDLASVAIGCSGRLPEPLDGLEYEIVEAVIEDVNYASLGLEGDTLRVSIKTPLIIDTKIMTPPPLRAWSVIVRAPQAYRLVPTPGYLMAAAARAWMAIVRGDSVSGSWTPYAVGRLSDVLMAEVDYRLKPVTLVYGRDDSGRMRLVRGVTGYAVYRILSPRMKPLVDRLLAFANRMGLGKNRSIGLGEVIVTPLGGEGGEGDTTGQG